MGAPTEAATDTSGHAGEGTLAESAVQMMEKMLQESVAENEDVFQLVQAAGMKRMEALLDKLGVAQEGVSSTAVRVQDVQKRVEGMMDEAVDDGDKIEYIEQMTKAAQDDADSVIQAAEKQEKHAEEQEEVVNALVQERQHVGAASEASILDKQERLQALKHVPVRYASTIGLKIERVSNPSGAAGSCIRFQFDALAEERPDVTCALVLSMQQDNGREVYQRAFHPSSLCW